MVESVILWFIPHMSSSTKRLAHYLINFCSYTHFVVPIDIVNLYTESFCGWGLTVGLHFQSSTPRVNRHFIKGIC